MAASRRTQTFDVFVGNLPPDANEKNVGKLFTPYGEIGGITVRESTKAKGPNKFYAFVKFLCEPDADKACQDLDKKNVSGVEITVKRAEKDRKRGQFDMKKKTGTPDSETSDSVGGSSHNADISEVVEREMVMITHVENPVTLWVQVVNDENTQKIFTITEQLATLCPAGKAVTTPEPGKTYASLYAEDNMWYRCQIKQTLGTDKYKIQYIDYGNTEEVNLSSLVEIPASVGTLKGLANKLVLHNMRAKDNTDKQAIQFLRSLTDNQMALLEKIRHLSDGSGFYGHLFVNDQSIGEAMLKAGFCQSRPLLGKAAGPNRQTDGPLESGPQIIGTSMFQVDKNALPRERNTTPPLSGVGFQQMSSGPPDLSREKELQSELARKRRELDKARSDKDTATIQLEYMRSKVKTLQDEFAKSAAKLQEDTMAKRINTLMTLAKVVRHLRDQFPTIEKRCMLEEAIDVCTSSDRVDNSKCTTLQVVGSALAKYKAAQDEISKCKQQSEIDDIVKSRDESRKELHHSLTICLEELSSLPLVERSKLVQDLQMKLTNIYGEYLKLQIHDCPSIENVAAGFKAWKMKKDSEFADVRTVTNFSEGAMQTGLSQIKERISIESGLHSDKPEVDIDDLMKTYAHALQREISVTDLIRSKDANLVATVISSVIRELQSESATLENFCVLKGEFKSRQASIAPWLDEKPTFAELHENRKLLRSLRSKLRHKMADKLDVEESGSEGELDSVKEEEEKIRSELQAALVRSDTLLHEVAALADLNFPELIVQYPDLAIDQFLMYKGLVKSNRELDHYSLKPGFKPGIHLSTFNGKPVMIQEFLLDQTTKEDFIKRVISYPGETCKIRGVFFSKNERQAYIECDWTEAEFIEKTIKDNMATPHMVQQICLQLIHEVITLHKHNCIHGEINTQSVLLRNDGKIVLTCPDFSKTVQERLSKKVTTENGLVFQCPDLQFSTGDLIGSAADVYNLVLFMFWLHCPSPKEMSFSNGSPDTRVNNLDTSLQALFDGVLRGKSANRLTAEQILQIEYFRKTLPDNFDPPPLFPAPVLAPSPPSQSPQPPIIKSMNEPMEIGVFRAEDFPTANKDEMQPSTVDTDDSWTTKSSSSGSRVESPLEDGIDANKTNMAEKQSTVNSIEVTGIESEFNNVNISGGLLHNPGVINSVVGVGSNFVAVTPSKGELGLLGPAGDNIPMTNDVFSQASDSEYLKEDRKSLGEILLEAQAAVTKEESDKIVEDGNC